MNVGDQDSESPPNPPILPLNNESMESGIESDTEYIVSDEDESSEEDITNMDYESKLAAVWEIAKEKEFIGLDVLVKYFGLNHGWLWCKLCEDYYIDLDSLKAHVQLKHPKADIQKITDYFSIT